MDIGALLKNLKFAALGIALISPAAWGLTTTPSGGFVLNKGNNASIDFSFQIQSDPGSKSYVFWAQQFWFESGPGGYLGLQRVGQTKKIIFSIWDAKASLASMPGAIAEPFGGEGEGQHVLAAFDWQVGHTYRFRLENVGGAGPWWQVSVTDVDTKGQWVLGRIQALPGWGNLQRNVTTFTEVFVNGERCENIPYARGAFYAPVADGGLGVTASITPRTYGNFSAPCSLLQVSGAKDGINVGTRSDKVDSAIVHQIGLSNGPQNWDDYDRKGKIGSIYKYQNPYTQKTEYFKLQWVDAGGRYGYFPIDGTNNAYWQYLGTTEPSYNGI
jgi:hypothetical protein